MDICDELFKKILKSFKIYVESEDELQFSTVRYRNKMYIYIYENGYKLVKIVLEGDWRLCYQLSSR